MKMKTRGSWKYAVIGLAAICLALPAPIFAQEAPAKVFKQEELDQLLAPIALYPDDLLTQILMASTYPLEVVQAERWVKQNKSLKGDALKAALDKQTWDDSVKALVPFPDVLTMMSEKLDWTQKLGDAFLAQQKDVMDTVQKLRRKADEAGNLKSSKEQEVKKEGDIIIIQPANPAGDLCSRLQPHCGLRSLAVPGLSALSGLCLPAGRRDVHVHDGCRRWCGLVHGWGHCNWHGGTVNINRNVTINRPGTARGRDPGGGGGGEQWKHNPEHRQGVAYRDQATRDKYSPTNRAAVDSRQGNRGYDKPGAGTADRSGGRQSAEQRVGRDSARTERPIDRVPGQRVRTTPSAGQTAAGGRRNGTAREAARACPRPSPTVAAHPQPSGGGALAGAAEEAADRIREENVPTSSD